MLQLLVGSSAAGFVEVDEDQNHHSAEHRIAQIDQAFGIPLDWVGVQVQQAGANDEGQRQHAATLEPEQQVGQHGNAIDPDKGGFRGVGNNDDVQQKAEGRQQVEVDPGQQVAHPNNAPGAPQQRPGGHQLEAGQQVVAGHKLQRAEHPEGQSGTGKDHADQRTLADILQIVD